MATGTDTLPYGELVIDSDDPEPDLAVVVNHPVETAEEWDLGESVTVARQNPQYPPDAPVVVVSFYDRLNQYDPDWGDFPDENRSLRELAEAGVGYYAFPRPRLERATVEVISEAVEPTPRTRALYDRLRDQMEVYFLDENTLEARKFGEVYRLRPGEVVTSGGILHDRLVSIAEEYGPAEAADDA